MPAKRLKLKLAASANVDGRPAAKGSDVTVTLATARQLELQRKVAQGAVAAALKASAEKAAADKAKA